MRGRLSQLAWLLAGWLLCFGASGCNAIGSGKLVQQLQNDNERLLSEFRAEKGRRESLEKLNQTLETRLAESEKLLARQYQESPRLSALQPEISRPLPPVNAGLSSPQSTGSGGAADLGNAASAADQFRWQRRTN